MSAYHVAYLDCIRERLQMLVTSVKLEHRDAWWLKFGLSVFSREVSSNEKYRSISQNALHYDISEEIYQICHKCVI